MRSRIKITSDIQQAIRKSIEKFGSQSELSRRSGISQKNISNYISSVNSLMNFTSWNKLHPFIAEFMSEDISEKSGIRNLQINGYSGEGLVVDCISRVTTRKEVIMSLVKKILESELQEKLKLEVIRIIISE